MSSQSSFRNAKELFVAIYEQFLTIDPNERSISWNVFELEINEHGQRVDASTVIIIIQKQLKEVFPRQILSDTRRLTFVLDRSLSKNELALKLIDQSGRPLDYEFQRKSPYVFSISDDNLSSTIGSLIVFDQHSKRNLVRVPEVANSKTMDH